MGWGGVDVCMSCGWVVVGGQVAVQSLQKLFVCLFDCYVQQIHWPRPYQTFGNSGCDFSAMMACMIVVQRCHPMPGSECDSKWHIQCLQYLFVGGCLATTLVGA